MDYEEDFLQTVRETLAVLKRRGKETETWSAHEGNTVTGWGISTGYFSDKDEEGRTYYREISRAWTVILAADGSFWWHQFETEESERYPDGHLTSYIKPLEISYFVGSEGKPFSKAKEELERLPYL